MSDVTSPRRPAPLALLVAMRPQQWTKNALVFAVPLAAGRLRELAVLRDTLGAFVAFCLAASATYLLNDAGDVEADRQHPRKRNRPIAAGELSPTVARVVAAVLLVASLVLALAIDRNLAITVAAYVGLTTAYTLWLKHQPILDIVAVATGFVLRAVAGATATSLPISEWFFVVASFGALLMVTGKREGELDELGEDASSTRGILAVYSPSFLTSIRSVAVAVVLVGYCLWAFDSAQVAQASQAPIFFQLSIVPFAVAILRYALLIDQGHGGEPERLIFSDRMLQLAGASWAIIYGYGVYLA